MGREKWPVSKREQGIDEEADHHGVVMSTSGLEKGPCLPRPTRHSALRHRREFASLHASKRCTQIILSGVLRDAVKNGHCTSTLVHFAELGRPRPTNSQTLISSCRRPISDLLLAQHNPVRFVLEISRVAQTLTNTSAAR